MYAVQWLVGFRLYAAVCDTNGERPAGMEHVPTLALVVITLLQLCRAQSSNSTPEWYAANVINDTNFSPKPITELFSTETSFSPEDPIVVLSSSSVLPSNRGIVSSPTPVPQYSDITDSQPPSVIPLSSTDLPAIPSLPVSETTSSDRQSQQGPSTTTQQTPTLEPTTSPIPNRQNVSPRFPSQNQPTFVANQFPPQQTQPRNIQFYLPPQIGNRIFQGQQLPTNGQSNVFVLYEQPQNIRNMPLPNPPIPAQSPALPSQPLLPVQQPTIVRVPNMMRQQPQMRNQVFPPPNLPGPVPPSNIPPPNIILAPQVNNQQQNGQIPINQLPNTNQQPINDPPLTNQPVYPMPNIQQPNVRVQQPINQMPQSPNVGTTVLRRRPLRQRNRGEGGRGKNRGTNNTQVPNTFPCQGLNRTVTGSAITTNTQNPVITIRLRPSNTARDAQQINRNLNKTVPTTVRPRQNSQANARNYERCLNSCREKKDRICAGPQGNVQINPDALKGFPSICHMACHNTFKANPIYERIANGRCGKLRTRIQTIDKTKVRRDELKKSQYTIISNVPGTVVELAP